jgi:ATP-dependent DNA helicase DinG
LLTFVWGSNRPCVAVIEDQEVDSLAPGPSRDGTTGLDALFGSDGPLADCLDNFAPRPEQLAMAEAVSQAIRESEHLLVEAGTGTGKTLAYLVPLLLAGQRGIVSTGTRTLQDQLFHRDLPMLGTALGRPARVRLLKGRANYLCHYRLERLLAGELPARVSASALRRVRAWSQQTRSGDVSELAGISDDSPLWPQITSTADNCLGGRCAFLADCHVAKARQAAREADIVVVNHHLLMADLTMKDSGFGQLLPGADAVIVDEAHHFPDTAQGFLNLTLGSGQLLDLGRDLRTEALDSGCWSADIEAGVGRLDTLVRSARAELGERVREVDWESAGTEFSAALGGIAEELEALGSELGLLEELEGGLARCRDRTKALADEAQSLLQTSDDDYVRWVRVTGRGFVATATPLDASGQIQALLEGQAASWIFTSATLAVGDDFSHFIGRVGLTGVSTRQVPSPFDFGRIARLYLPRGLPDPSQHDYTDRVMASIRPVVAASRGRAFLLFTSHRALRRAAELLRDASEFDYPLLVQGEAPRSRLLDDFARLENAVLLGTATFWEGVDIRGDGLVLVVIDRLPFASPGDPMLAARLQAIRNAGGNPFRDYQLPQAVLSLKQGVGRLIRDYSDYGVVMICDPRLESKSYGRVFLNSLPPMQVVHEVADVEDFFAEREAMA